MKKLRVYIAGPYTVGDPVTNIAHAIDVGNKVLELGHTPFIPHTNMLWHFRHPHDAKTWYDWDNEWLKVCNAVIRIPGASPGGDAEVALARRLGIPVFFGIETFASLAASLADGGGDDLSR